MNEFDWEIKQKKALVPSARRRKCGSKSKACTLPSDYLTEGAKRKLNSEVVTISLDKPVKYGDLVKASQDLQRQYISGLQDKYNASIKMLSGMLDVSYTKTRKLLDELGLIKDKTASHAKRHQVEAWEKFCGVDPVDPETTEAEETTEQSAKVSNDKEPIYISDDEELSSLTVRMTGSAYSVCKRLIAMIGTDKSGSFAITFEAERSETNG